MTSPRQLGKRVTGLVTAALLSGCANLDMQDAAGRRETCPTGYDFQLAAPQKIGLGAWELGEDGAALARLRSLGVSWYYDWTPHPLSGPQMGKTPDFVPMVWGAPSVQELQGDIAAVRASQAKELLAFNEPDKTGQSALGVDAALSVWPQLAATGKTLGSPAPSQTEALGEGRWLPDFVARARADGVPPDFIAVHYYAGTPDVDALRRFLEAVHTTYGKTIWLTEWGLVHPATWLDGRARYSMDDAACFFRAGSAMMDDLPYLERHAWFAAFDGGDGWRLNIHAIGDDGSLTPVGRAIRDASKGVRRR